MELLGLVKAGSDEIEKARREVGVKIEKCNKGSATFTVTLNQVDFRYLHFLKSFFLLFTRVLMTWRKTS